MSTQTRTFRVFVSSTFADLSAERNAIAVRVFPRLRVLCQQHGTRFQAVDLRWGVSGEATLDQRTMLICLEELRRCQRISPRPSFVVLLGDRYGWRPPPYAIPGDEFAEIERRCSVLYRTLLAEWYLRDDNAVVKRGGRTYTEYVLRARAGVFEDDERWGEVERELRSALAEATAGMDLAPEARLKYDGSATEQEIAHGALAVPDAREHVHCYFRRIANFDQLGADASANEDARAFADFNGAGLLNEEALTRLLDLKDRLSKALAGQVREYDTRWTEGRVTNGHIDRLCEDVHRDLERIILSEIARIEVPNAATREQALHEAFAQERTATFVGREAILDRIDQYISGTATYPLVLFGPSGSGKSTVMAQAAALAAHSPLLRLDQEGQNKSGTVLIQRFIGRTPRSSDGRALLRSLLEQISEAFDFDQERLRRLSEIVGSGKQACSKRLAIEAEYAIPHETHQLLNRFSQLLTKVPQNRRLIIFIDAIDQLPANDPAMSLSWLPSVLPPQVRLAISILSDEQPQQVASRLPPEALVRLEPMPVTEGSDLLDRWLAKAHRTLQPQQRRNVLDAFATNGFPLYLKVAFEEARRWRSFTPADQAVPGRDVPGAIRDLLERLEKDHGQTLVGRSLALLGISRGGLSEDEMLDLLSNESDVIAEFTARSSKSPDLGSDPRLPVIVWSRLFYDLEPYLSERAAEGATVLSFYHRQLAAAVDTRYLASEDLRKAQHAVLATYFMERWPLPDLHALKELPHHAVQSGSSELIAHVVRGDFFETQASMLGNVLALMDSRIVAAALAREGDYEWTDLLRCAEQHCTFSERVRAEPSAVEVLVAQGRIEPVLRLIEIEQDPLRRSKLMLATAAFLEETAHVAEAQSLRDRAAAGLSLEKTEVRLLLQALQEAPSHETDCGHERHAARECGKLRALDSHAPRRVIPFDLAVLACLSNVSRTLHGMGAIICSAIPLILGWTNHSSWLIRSASYALSGLLLTSPIWAAFLLAAQPRRILAVLLGLAREHAQTIPSNAYRIARRVFRFTELIEKRPLDPGVIDVVSDIAIRSIRSAPSADAAADLLILASNVDDSVADAIAVGMEDVEQGRLERLFEGLAEHPGRDTRSILRVVAALPHAVLRPDVLFRLFSTTKRTRRTPINLRGISRKVIARGVLASMGGPASSRVSAARNASWKWGRALGLTQPMHPLEPALGLLLAIPVFWFASGLFQVFAVPALCGGLYLIARRESDQFKLPSIPRAVDWKGYRKALWTKIGDEWVSEGFVPGRWRLLNTFVALSVLDPVASNESFRVRFLPSRVRHVLRSLVRSGLIAHRSEIVLATMGERDLLAVAAELQEPKTTRRIGAAADHVRQLSRVFPLRPAILDCAIVGLLSCSTTWLWARLLNSTLPATIGNPLTSNGEVWWWLMVSSGLVVFQHVPTLGIAPTVLCLALTGRLWHLLRISLQSPPGVFWAPPVAVAGVLLITNLFVPEFVAEWRGGGLLYPTKRSLWIRRMEAFFGFLMALGVSLAGILAWSSKAIPWLLWALAISLAGVLAWKGWFTPGDLPRTRER